MPRKVHTIIALFMYFVLLVISSVSCEDRDPSSAELDQLADWLQQPDPEDRPVDELMDLAAEGREHTNLISKVGNKIKGLIGRVRSLFTRDDARTAPIVRKAEIGRNASVKIVRPPPTGPPAQRRSYLDQDFKAARRGVIPEGAFVAGMHMDGQRVFAARVYLVSGGDIVPAMIAEGDYCAMYLMDNVIHCNSDYQVLMGHSYIWYEKSSQHDLHPDVQWAGQTTWGGEKHSQGLCRVLGGSGHPLLGRFYIKRLDWGCIAPNIHGGKAIDYNEYSVLLKAI